MMRWWIVTGLAFVLAGVFPHQGQPAEVRDKESLRNVPGMGVHMDISDECKAYGLTDSQIRSDVELKLRTAGVKILSENEREDAPGRPWLYVRAHCVGDEDGYPIAFRTDVSFHQDVHLERNRHLVVLPTWDSSATLGVTNSQNLLRIRDSMKRLVDQFLNDYLAVNPK
jgi:hypothetical protein